MATQRAGPELPPHLLAKRKRQAETTTERSVPEPKPDPRIPATSEELDSRHSTPDSASKKRRIVGPAPPPAPLDERPLEDPEGDGEDSGEEDFGPAPPKAGTYQRADGYADHEFDHTASATTASAAQERATRRDDWMTMPPKQDDLAARMDPTKIKAKGFNTAKGARGPNQAGGVDSTLWTETPEEKRKRLENEVLGITEPSTNHKEDIRTRQSRKEDEEKARHIREHNEKHRSKTLYEQHQGSARKKEEDDPSKRAFDYEKDMAALSKIGHGQRKDLLNKSADFSSKFSSGNYL